ncbi:MAG: tetratricopeptide repeat protein [Candidatus Latescibacteria bacterium]|nr:tetratricopeptide repeat protein [Candidatus Latescibacterota bacterium]
MNRHFIALLVLLPGLPTSSTAEQPLARLSFWVPALQQDKFTRLHDDRLVPLLERHGLVQGVPPDRAIPDGVFSRLFALDNPAAITAKQTALRADSSFATQLVELGKALSGPDAAPLRFRFAPYSSPAGPGRKTPAGPGRSHWQTYDVSTGLNDNLITALAQTQDSTLWIGTAAGGLNRFDGHEFTDFSHVADLGYSSIQALCVDRDGQLWIGHEQGLHHYRDGQLEAVPLPDSLQGTSIFFIVQQRQGPLWLATGNPAKPGIGLLRYDGAHFTLLTTADGLPSNRVGRMAEDADGGLWIGTLDGQLSRYDKGRFTHYTTPADLLGHRISALLVDRANSLWIGTLGDGLRRFDGRQFTHFTVADGLPSSSVGPLVQDRDGRLWIGTRQGLSRYDGGRFTNFTTADGLPELSIFSLLEDGEGRLWVGTQGRGLARHSDEITTFTTADGLAHNTTGTLYHDPHGVLWIGTNDGLSRYDGTHFTTWTTADGLPFKAVGKTHMDGQNRLWFGTFGGGIGYYDGERFVAFGTDDGLPHDFAVNLAGAGPDSLWVGTAAGLALYNKGRFTAFDAKTSLPHPYVNTLLTDSRGQLWIATMNGLARYDGQAFSHYSMDDGLGHYYILSLAEDRQGQIWVGTNGGLSLFDGERFATFTMADGLAGNIVWRLYQDRSRDQLWLGTLGGGVGRYDGHSFQVLRQADGLAEDIAWDLSQDRNDNWWFAHDTQGITRFRPKAPSPPPITIDAVRADRRYPAAERLVLETGPTLVSFEFHGRSFRTRPEAMAYRYRLLGHQDQWRNTHATRVEYEALPVGQYTFEVVAVDRDLTRSGQPARINVEIQPQVFTSPLRLAAVEMEDLFASFYGSYTQQPLGQVEIANDGAEPLEATLRFALPELMQRPFEVPLQLAPGSTQRVSLHPQLDAQTLDRQQSHTIAAELSLERPDFSIKANPAPVLRLYGRGALRWDSVSRAAAFITSNAPQVADFARPPLVAFEAETDAWGRPLDNILQALVLFEALRAHGVRYIADANTPYAQMHADRGTVDHIQYPAESLASRAGDCDDLTVLYAALLENAGIATALVDYPGHIFLLFDTGVTRKDFYSLPIDESLYLIWGDRLWIPVEITQLDQPFERAWRLGAEKIAPLAPRDLHRRLVRTADAWREYPAAAPTFASTVPPPDRAALQTSFERQYAALQDLIGTHIQTAYLDSLTRRPNNDSLRTQLLKLYLSLRQFDTAIETGLANLLDKRGDEGATYNNLGIAYFLKGQFAQAAFYFEQAIKLHPQDKGIEKNWDRALRALGRKPFLAADDLAAAPASAPKAARIPRVDSFYWMD